MSLHCTRVNVQVQVKVKVKVKVLPHWSTGYSFGALFLNVSAHGLREAAVVPDITCTQNLLSDVLVKELINLSRLPWLKSEKEGHGD